MPMISASRFVVMAAFLFLYSPHGVLAQVNVSELNNLLVGKNVVAAPNVKIGFTGTTKNPKLWEGKPVHYPVKTQIYPNSGDEWFRIEYGTLHADADTYGWVKSEISFRILNIDAKEDSLELEMPTIGEDGQPELKDLIRPRVEFLFGKGWKVSMTTEAVVQAVMKYLPTKEYLAKAEADAARQQAEEQSKIAGHRDAEEKKIDPVLLAKAKAGDSEAQYSVGLLFIKGSGVERDPERANYWFHESAVSGNARAQNAIGLSYKNAISSEKDIAQAVDWFKKSAAQDNSDAEANLGDMYHRGLAVKEDQSEAFSWYLKAASQGNSHAEDLLGNMYLKGQATPRDLTKAESWIRKAAEQGDSDAQWLMGLFYDYGTVVTQSYPTALAWYRKSADQGYSPALTSLGLWYRDGRGVQQDYEAAAQWFRKAAEESWPDAQFELGSLYEHGKGVKQDLSLAMSLYRKAASMGSSDAQKKQGEVGETADGGSTVPKELRARQPREGTPTYLATATWISEKLPSFTNIRFMFHFADPVKYKSMDGCIMRYIGQDVLGREIIEKTFEVPLYDVYSIDLRQDCDSGYFTGTTCNWTQIAISTKNHGTFELHYYGTDGLLQRMHDAVKHAAELCIPAANEQQEPF